ncbi:hypothetical protein TNCV_564191 [Trichonephila clavipes]|nr:hypothetical protein TNCV_564191 [Trichonephila clavipes]
MSLDATKDLSWEGADACEFSCGKVFTLGLQKFGEYGVSGKLLGEPPPLAPNRKKRQAKTKWRQANPTTVTKNHRDEFSATSGRPSNSPFPLRLTLEHFPDVIPTTEKKIKSIKTVYSVLP